MKCLDRSQSIADAPIPSARRGALTPGLFWQRILLLTVLVYARTFPGEPLCSPFFFLCHGTPFDAFSVWHGPGVSLVRQGRHLARAGLNRIQVGTQATALACIKLPSSAQNLGNQASLFN